MHYVYRECPCGPIRGIGNKTYDMFRSVRYANAQRWEAPVPVTQWEGEFDATVQGHACPQTAGLGLFITGTNRFYRNEVVEKLPVIYSEDCLNLNIFVPKGAKDLPVMVNIHGGGYEGGSNLGAYFQGEAICRRNVVLVTINYRLNVLANAVGDGHTGNYGLQDQICALEWIQRNISAFGGDPGKVTIMGESAGAMSVQNLILSPMAKGLFHRAIMQSGGGILPRAYRIKSPEAITELWKEVKAYFGVDTIDGLKELPYKDVLVAWKSISMKNIRYATPATPVIDGRFIPEDPTEMVAAGRFNHVPTLHMVLSEDMWPHTLYTTILRWAEQMRPFDLPVYGAYFDRAAPGSDHGAFHSTDVKYVFGALDACWRPHTEVDYRISDNLIDYFTSFAKTGVPAVEGLPVWQPLSSEQTRFMHFGNEPCNMENVPEDQLSATQAKGKPFPGM